MVNEQTERTEVLVPCMKLCKKLKSAGYILKYRRLDALDYYHESGDPDIEIWISKNDILVIIMAECKKPSGGTLSNNQIECRDKYKVFKNVIYIEIRDVETLKSLIMNIAESKYFNKDIFKEFLDLKL